MQSTSEATIAVRALLTRLVDAWGRHDADAYGALFTEDASYTTYVGTFYRGRRDITESHRILFAGFLKGTRLADEVLDVRFYRPDVAVVNSRGDTHKAGRPAKLGKVQTYTLVRDAGEWRIAAFQNTRRRPLMERISFAVAPGLTPGGKG
ncbi:SgcJ/EcaC family oxidoreductase [Streptomyces sp. NPDC059917]|uniref:SgcJ/EcaC family oxidoreductase n=1 Tax=Streptomyces sp. NPDC059917 TaxID=3347002 RepID=UPI003669ABCD